MTEDTGFAEPEETPAEPETAAEDAAEAEPATDAETPAEPAEDASEPPAADSTPNAPEPMPAPDLPAEGVQESVRNALNYLHERLVRLGG